MVRTWGQDIQLEDIGDTSSNTSESVNARLNRYIPTSYQKFTSSAKHLWESHKEVLDQYAAQFNYGTTPGRKRKKSTQERWDHLNNLCEQFHNLETHIQCETLIDYLCNCSVFEPEPHVPHEKDPCSDFE